MFFGFSGPDALPHPLQLPPRTFTVNPLATGWNSVRISHSPDLKAEDIAWFHSHSEVCDNNIVEQPLHGIEPVCDAVARGRAKLTS